MELNRDELLLICEKLNPRDVIRFCLSCKKVFNKIYSEAFTRGMAKYENYEWIEGAERNERYVYNLLYNVSVLKKKLKLKETEYEILQMKILPAGYKGLTEIPKEIFYLKNVENIDLSCNCIVDIPKNICKLQKLKHLDLSNNFITDVSNLCGLKKLKYLHLHDNLIVTLPRELSYLSDLTSLFLYENKINNVPKELSNLINLQYLYLNNNKLKYIPQELGNLTNLKIFNLSNNHIYAIQLQHLANFNSIFCLKKYP